MVVKPIMEAARTGNVGDGLVSVGDVAALYLTRTGELVSG